MNQADIEVLKWIKKELSEVIKKAIIDSKTINYTESDLAAIACRETGNIISKNMGKSSMLVISSIARGDFTKRPKDKEKVYHGFSFWQIDIDSFPEFVKSGNWKDPYKSCLKAISVLEGKRKYILSKYPNMPAANLHRSSIAAYNCGEGNAVKVLAAKADIDSRTAHGNYSKSVLEFKETYNAFTT